MNNKLIIIAAPSGAGKTSVTKHLLKTFPDQLIFSISCATRPPRNHEKHGVDYYFISIDEFKRRIGAGEFAEWQMVYEEKYYGTLKSELIRIWEHHKTPLLDVDVRGGYNIEKQIPQRCLSLFIEPPSIAELEKRLKARGTESGESLKARIEKASFEMTYKDFFDHIVLNDVLERACKEAERIVRAFLNS